MSNESDSIREIARLIRESYIGSKAANFTDEDAFWRNIAKGVYHAALEFAKYDLAAARQPAPVVEPSDEELVSIYLDNWMAERMTGHDGMAPELAGIRAIRDALAAQAVRVPEIPEGWELSSITPVVKGGYNASLTNWELSSATMSTKGYVNASADSWQDALRDAIEQAKGES